MESSYLLIGVLIEMEQEAALIGALVYALLGAGWALAHSTLRICWNNVVRIKAVPPNAPGSTKQWVKQGVIVTMHN